MSATARSHKTPRRLVGAALGLTLVVAAAPFFSSANAAQPTSDTAAAQAETDNVAGANATDPALWIHPTDPTKSMIIGANDTKLSTYGIDGKILEAGTPGAAGDFTGVDTRDGFSIGGSPVSLATAVGNGVVRFYAIDHETRDLTDVSSTAGGITDLPKHQGSVSRVCMYKSPVSGKTYAFVMTNNGGTQQLELTETAGKVDVNIVRGHGGPQSGAWDVATTVVDPQKSPAVAGCVVDDETKTLYVSERDAGIWKFGAEPTDPITGTLIDRPSPDGNLMTATKGLAIVRTGAGTGYLLASTFDSTAPAATDASFNVYDRAGGNAFIRTFKVTAGTAADNCHESDGIDASAAPNLAAGFAQGMFVCQDTTNRPATGGGTEGHNYKMVPMELIADMAAPVPTTVTTAPTATTTTTAPVQVPAPNRSGYWMVGSEGKVYAFGEAKTFGDASLPAGARAVDLEPTPSGNGYWIIDDLGNVYARGDAMAQPALDRSKLTTGEVVTSLSSTKEGKGYWIFTSLGQVIPFGDAIFHGDMSKTKLNGPVLDSIPTASGKGYYMVASDGGIFSFGDAAFKGSMGNVKLNKPVQSLVPDSDGVGYWLVASDGGIFAFDAPFKGSLGSVKLNKPITGMVRYGDGYVMVGEDGGIFNYSNKPFSGSLGASPPAKPITSVAVLDVAAR